ncbi:MAG: Lpg1974 family pore-forming outer membrane protein [Chlamydiota bacterium]
MWNIDVDLLYWQPQENGLEFAAEERAIHPEFDWHPGFRFGCGYRFRRDDWQVELIFTHFHAHEKGKTKGELTPLFSNPVFFEEDSFVNKADFKWRLHFGEFDLVLKKKIYASLDTDITPFLGVRVACIRQKYRIQYYGGNLFPGADDLVTTKNKFFGTGIVTGSHFNWILGKGWQLYATGGASLLYGSFYVHQAEYADVGVEKRFGFHKTFPATAPVLDLALGAYWERGSWNVHLGWEQHYFFGQNQWVRLTSHSGQDAYASNLGSLSLQGIVFGTTITF